MGRDGRNGKVIVAERLRPTSPLILPHSGTGCLPSAATVCPKSGRSLREADPAQRLVFAGDPQRGIPPCSACHGPGGYKLGAPALEGQQAAYIERQLAAFAQGTRENDIFQQMRIVAKQLTSDEMHALAVFYSMPGSGKVARR